MGAPIRILYVHNGADLYGASRSLLRLVAALDRERFASFVVVPTDGPLRPMLESAGAQVFIHPGLSIVDRWLVKSWRLPLFPFQFVLSVRRLRLLIRRLGIKVVHTNVGVIPSGALAARLAGVPHIWHIREWFQEFRGLWQPYSRYITRNSHRVIAISEAMAQQFGERRKVVVLHNGIALDEFAVPAAEYASEFRTRWDLGAAFVVGCIGRIKLVRKGQEVLVQAMAQLVRTRPDVRCVIVGSVYPGNETHLEELQRMVNDLKLSRHVIFTGEIADPRSVYPALNALVLPSVQPEPLGGVVMEAMAMGVPVVATNIGGPLEMIVDGETGFLVPPGDSAALADRLLRLIDDPTLGQRFAGAATRRLIEGFALADKVRSIERIYTEAVDGMGVTQLPA